MAAGIRGWAVAAVEPPEPAELPAAPPGALWRPVCSGRAGSSQWSGLVTGCSLDRPATSSHWQELWCTREGLAYRLPRLAVTSAIASDSIVASRTCP